MGITITTKGRLKFNTITENGEMVQSAEQTCELLRNKLKQETLRREEAEKVIDFYGTESNWKKVNQFMQTSLSIERSYGEHVCGNKKAREYKDKYKDEK